MNYEQAQANLKPVLDWIDALRRSDIDSIAERFHPDVAWEDVAGGLACEGREQVLARLRRARRPAHAGGRARAAGRRRPRRARRPQRHPRQELAGVQLDGQLFTVFTLRDGQIVHLHDQAHRDDALAEAGLDSYQWL